MLSSAHPGLIKVPPGAQGLKPFITSIYTVMRMRVEFVARVRCRIPKKLTDGTPYVLCYINIPKEHRDKLKGRWVKVTIEEIG